MATTYAPIRFDPITGLFETAPAPAAPAAPERYQPAPDLDPYDPASEPLHDYQARALRYILQTGRIATLDRETLAQADMAAMRTACSLPKDLNATDLILNRKIADVRTRIAFELARRRQALARFAAVLDDGPGPDVDSDGPPAGPDAAPESDADRAVRLFKAAVLLIMGPVDGSQDDGGRKAPLIPPSPSRPPQGPAMQPPAPAPVPAARTPQPVTRPQPAKPADGIQF